MTPEQRHLEQAFANVMAHWTDPSSFPDDWQPNELYTSIVMDLYTRGRDHPDVILEARILAAREARDGRIIEMLGGREALRDWSDRGPDDVDDARLLEEIDAGWDGSGWKPSELYAIMCGVAGKHADQAKRNALARARDRYRDGFHADPFTKEPRRRIA